MFESAAPRHATTDGAVNAIDLSLLASAGLSAISSVRATGSVLLDCDRLRDLRLGRMLSQQDLADECWRRNIQVSIATIKRAESGRAVRYRIARELARCFDVPVATLIHA